MKKFSYVQFCTKPWEELVVYPDGQYSICCGGLPVGKIQNVDDIKDLWNNPIILQYRENLNNEFEFGICTNCTFHKTLRNTNFNEHKRAKRDIYADSIPIISFGLTDQCNLSCFMCGVSKKYQSINRKLHADRLPLEYCQAFAEHHFSNANIVNSNCFGELFLYPRLRPFLTLLKNNRPKSYTTTTTSGSIHVPEKIWRLILESHDQIIFSIDSHDKTIHKIIRGFDYETFEKNIRLVQRLQTNEYSNFKYGCSIVLMKLTIATFFDTLKKTHEEYGCRLFHFQHITGVPSQSLANEREWRVLYNVSLKKCQEYISKYGLETNGDIGLYLDKNGCVEE